MCDRCRSHSVVLCFRTGLHQHGGHSLSNVSSTKIIGMIELNCVRCKINSLLLYQKIYLCIYISKSLFYILKRRKRNCPQSHDPMKTTHFWIATHQLRNAALEYPTGCEVLHNGLPSLVPFGFEWKSVQTGAAGAKSHIQNMLWGGESSDVIHCKCRPSAQGGRWFGLKW